MITRDVLKALRQNAKNAKQASHEEAVTTLKRIGIINKRGALAKPYRMNDSEASGTLKHKKAR